MPNMEHLTQAREPCEEHRLIRIAIIIDKAEVDTSGQRARSAGDHVSRADQGEKVAAAFKGGGFTRLYLHGAG